MLIMITWYCSYSWLDTTMLKSNTVIARPAPNNGYCAVCIANNWRIILMLMLKMLEISPAQCSNPARLKFDVSASRKVDI